MRTDELDDLFGVAPDPFAGSERRPGAAAAGPSLPVRWTNDDRDGRRDEGGGTGILMAAHDGDDPSGNEVDPDAVGRGWVTPPGGARVEALFVLSGSSLGIGRTERLVAPVWLSLEDLVNLDAIGDPVDGLLEVEISMADGTVISAGWPEPFCEAVVTVLQEQLDAVSDATGPSGDAPSSVAPSSTTDEGPAEVAADVEAAFDVETDLVPVESDPADADVADLPAPALRLVTEDERADAVVDRDAPADDPADGGTASEDATATSAHGPDVRFDEIVPSDVERQADPVAEAAPQTPLPEPATGVFSAQPVVRNRRRTEAQSAGVRDETAATGAATFGVGTTDAAPVPSEPQGPRANALELEDVVYLGGYPGQTRKRKKCTAVLTHEGLEVAGPGDLRFRIVWDSVQTVEAQNSDEARFRMNTKIHRDSSALVVECDQGVTVLLEARDCPTIPLRSAIGQLLADLPVVVV